MNDSLITDTSRLIEKDFDLALKEGVDTESDLLEWLKPHVQLLLNRDFERLLQICYRIDLGENLLKKILHESQPEQMVVDLSLAIIRRQKLKIEIRRKYSS
ncbi:hypothetical protein MM239_11150 [Belliella sp. DSM 111904]|uniref:Uncharacterized protein n=1 Tax=Belliella filtrata TaxID=2923435 RepID=A0ABS9V0L4_9BACT|nr:hypothetical protein [Belliella filtrata]MCH7409951.1 hypothetical protein [Belliella filtrata]